jgi:hypothetical protein
VQEVEQHAAAGGGDGCHRPQQRRHCCLQVNARGVRCEECISVCSCG